MADNEMKTVSDAIAETMKLVTTSTALVDHYAGKIKQIDEEIELIEDSADNTAKESRYKILKERRKSGEGDFTRDKRASDGNERPAATLFAVPN